MALMKAVSAEWNTLDELDGYQIYNGMSVSSTQARSGTYAFEMKGGSNFEQFFFVTFTARNELYMQFALYPGQVTDDAAMDIMKWSKGATVLGGLRKGMDGRINCYSGAMATLLGTSTNTLSQSVWNLLEVRIKIADSGVVQFRLDGNLEVDFSGDTQPGADTTIDTIHFGCLNHRNYSYSSYIDDIIINDTTGAYNNSWPNGLKTALLRPSAVGAFSQWTPSVGTTNFMCVDETPPSSTDYITTIIVDAQDTYVIGDCPSSAAVISAVVPQYWALGPGTPTISHVGPLLRIGSTVYEESQILIPSTLGLMSNILETSPATLTVFTTTEVNALEFGLKAKA